MFKYCRGTLASVGRYQVKLGVINIDECKVYAQIQDKAQYGVIDLRTNTFNIWNDKKAEGLATNRVRFTDLPKDVSDFRQVTRNHYSKWDEKFACDSANKVFVRLIKMMVEGQVSGKEIYQDLRVDGYTLPMDLAPRHGGGWIPSRGKGEDKTVVPMVEFLKLVYSETTQIKETGRP